MEQNRSLRGRERHRYMYVIQLKDTHYTKVVLITVIFCMVINQLSTLYMSRIIILDSSSNFPAPMPRPVRNFSNLQILEEISREHSLIQTPPAKAQQAQQPRPQDYQLYIILAGCCRPNKRRIEQDYPYSPIKRKTTTDVIMHACIHGTFFPASYLISDHVKKQVSSTLNLVARI